MTACLLTSVILADLNASIAPVDGEARDGAFDIKIPSSVPMRLALKSPHLSCPIQFKVLVSGFRVIHHDLQIPLMSLMSR